MENIEEVKRYWLTTTDNPYDPFEDFKHWYMYDTSHGYFTAGLVARIAKTSTDLTDDEYQEEVNRAINFIIANGLGDNYKRVEQTIE